MTVDIAGLVCSNKDSLSKDLPHTLSEYCEITRKIVNSVASRIDRSLAKHILNNEDILSNLVTEAMMADCCFNGTGTIEGYRKQRVTWGILNYLKRRKRNNRGVSLHNTYSDGDEEYVDSIECPYTDQNDLENKEYVDVIMQSKRLTERQRVCIKGYYLEGKTYNEIGQELNISRQAVHQFINKGLENLRSLNG